MNFSDSIQKIQDILDNLSKRRFDDVAASIHGDISELEIRQAIEDYEIASGERLSSRPALEIDDLEPIFNETECIDNFSWFYLDVDLWCDGKLSDLTAQFSVEQTKDGIKIYLQDIHVL